jgi:hypothetical protein
MRLFPKIKRCPCCDSINIINVNGIIYDNLYQSLRDWKLKKIFDCRKCNVELALFFNNSEKKEILLWVDYLKCEDNYYDQLNKLQINKEKYKRQKKKYDLVVKEIIDIQNKIQTEKVKLKIKYKIQHNSAHITLQNIN